MSFGGASLLGDFSAGRGGGGVENSKFSASGGDFLQLPQQGKPCTEGIPQPLNPIWKKLHKGANRLIHPYECILTSPVMCSQQLSVLD